MEIELEDLRPPLDKFWSDFYVFNEILPGLDDRFVYRGQSDIDHHLISSIIRSQHLEHSWRFLDNESFAFSGGSRSCLPHRALQKTSISNKVSSTHS